jgi:hypothetical protein
MVRAEAQVVSIKRRLYKRPSNEFSIGIKQLPILKQQTHTSRRAKDHADRTLVLKDEATSCGA